MTSVILTWFGAVATLFFGILSIVFYRRSIRSKRLALVFTSSSVSTTLHSELKIQFRGRHIHQLARCLIAIWNDGSDAIRSTDIPAESKPTIFIPKANTFLVAIVARSSAANSFNAEIASPESISIAFSYLNPGDGAVLELYYEPDVYERQPALDVPLIGGVSPMISEFAPAKARSRRFARGILIAWSILYCLTASVIAVAAVTGDEQLLILAFLFGTIAFLTFLIFAETWDEAKAPVSTRIPDWALSQFSVAA